MAPLQTASPELVVGIVTSDPLSAVVFLIGASLLGTTLLIGGLLTLGAVLELLTPAPAGRTRSRGA